MDSRLELGVNIDHVATLRQVRYRALPDSPQAEPDLVTAATLCEEGGADQITIHLREDRRHIQDEDVRRLRDAVQTRINLEMGQAADILALALEVRPASVCLVPENRQEVTTEGGLDAVGGGQVLRETVRRCQSVGIRVSLFIDPLPEQIEAAARLGAEMVELHTGAFANAAGAERAQEVQRLQEGAELAHRHGLQVNAGHGLTTRNLPELFQVPHLRELNIGHHIVCRALEIGLRQAVMEMRTLMDRYPVRL